MNAMLSKERRRLLTLLEGIVGSEFYNAHIQNYGPGGVREADGRALRYPITFREDDEKIKFKEPLIPKVVPIGAFLTGHYALGANQLDIMVALDRVLRRLEERYSLSFDELERNRTALADSGSSERKS